MSGSNLQASPRASSRRPRHLLIGVAASLVSLLFSLLIAESALRLLGFQPLTSQTWQGRVEPDGRYWASDRLLGYRNIPGAYTVWFPNGHSWTMTHLANGNRATRETPSDTGGSASADQRESVWIFGCSFIHGWGVNDDETLPWLLQEKMPEYDVENYGVGGYGTLQILLMLRSALDSVAKKPKVVVLAHASFHDQRNTLEWDWRKTAYEYADVGQSSQPFARIDRGGQLVIGHDSGAEWMMALMRVSALAHLLGEKVNGSYDRLYLQSEEVTHALISMIAEECARRDIEFVLAGISADGGTLQALVRNFDDMPTVDMSADLRRPGFAVPGDGHPTKLANNESAAKLARFVRTHLAKSRDRTN